MKKAKFKIFLQVKISSYTVYPPCLGMLIIGYFLYTVITRRTSNRSCWQMLCCCSGPADVNGKEILSVTMLVTTYLKVM